MSTRLDGAISETDDPPRVETDSNTIIPVFTTLVHTTTMLVTRPRKVSLTLFCYFALVLALASVAQADSFEHHARDHAGISRMLKKRAPQILPSGLPPLPPGLGTNGAAGDPPNLNSPSPGDGASPTSSAGASAPTDDGQSSTDSAASSTSASAASQSSDASVSEIMQFVLFHVN